MIRIISALIAIMFIAFGVNAWADKVLDPTANYAYLEDTKVQAGTTVDIKLKVCAENQDDYWAQIGTVIGYFQFPDGVTVNSVTGNNNACTFNPAINEVVLGQCEGKDWVCTVNISVPEDMPAGDYDMSFADFQIVAHNAQDDAKGTHTTTLTIQKSAVINELPEGFGVTITPFVAEDGDITLNFNYKSSKDIKNLSFDVQLPEGMFFMDDVEWDPENTTSSLTASCTGAPTLSHQLADGDAPSSVSIKVAGTYSAKSQKFINASVQYNSLATISACVLTQHDIDEYEWDSYIMTEGLSTIKLSNIVIEDIDGNKYTGEYLASVIFGQPATQEVILYGQYDAAAADAFTTALKNVAIADVTAATVDEDAKFTDVLVNEKDGNSYYTRTSANYGTTVLPLDLASTPNCKLYTILDMSSEGIVIEETENVPANTPCIFKGTINVEGATPTLDVPSEQFLGQTIFKGTYSATNIASGAGYYISSDGKFYGDGATVRPFRGYFDGAIAGAKTLRVFVDEVTGLKDITDQLSDEAIYSLQGIRMNKVQKGVNIKGGKKTFVK